MQKLSVSKSLKSTSIIYYLITVGIFFRIILIPVEPNLTDDYFRFYWDGLLNVQYISPYAYLPIDLMQNGLAEKFHLSEELFEKLNSPKYFSVYPPILQWLFMGAAAISGPNNLLLFVSILKLFILCFEVGSIVLLLKILRLIQQPLHWVLWYVLNPLVIIELNGNLHFEAAMVFFVLLAFYLLYTKKSWLYAAAAIAGGVASKLIPLIFLPFLIKRIGLKKTLIFGFSVTFSLLLVAFRFIDPPIVKNLFSSVKLYYNTFEFNASLYYIFRWIGYQIKGWNMIATIGKITALSTFCIILCLAYLEHKKTLISLLRYALFALTVYLLLANIVHPWYIVPLIALGSLSGFGYPIVWSWLIGLSYFAYSNPDYQENMLLITIEYITVIGCLIFELIKKPLLITRTA